jgi:RNA polymerase sigma-70 factor (ECF subfamily)
VRDKDVRVTDETSALERAYRDEGERLWRALLAYTGDPAVADDAVAEAFAQALRRGDDLREPGRWVWAVSFRLARAELSRRRHAREDEGIVEVEYEMPEPTRDLLDALKRLSPKQRACVVLYHYADYPVKEVASMLDSTPAAVKVHLSQGRKRMRVWLGEGMADA